MENTGILTLLDETEMKALVECVETLDIHADAEVIEQGAPNDSLFIVRDGLLHAHRLSGRRRVLLGRLDPGKVFGEISLFDPGPATATVRAVTESRVLKLHSRGLDRLAATCPSAALKLMRALLAQVAQRLRNTDMRLVDSISWSGLER